MLRTGSREEITCWRDISNLIDSSTRVSIPSGSRLAPLTLEATNSLLSPLGSHLQRVGR
jgi:hypothetical protein